MGLRIVLREVGVNIGVADVDRDIVAGGGQAVFVSRLAGGGDFDRLIFRSFPDAPGRKPALTARTRKESTSNNRLTHGGRRRYRRRLSLAKGKTPGASGRRITASPGDLSDSRPAAQDVINVSAEDPICALDPGILAFSAICPCGRSQDLRNQVRVRKHLRRDDHLPERAGADAFSQGWLAGVNWRRLAATCQGRSASASSMNVPFALRDHNPPASAMPTRADLCSTRRARSRRWLVIVHPACDRFQPHTGPSARKENCAGAFAQDHPARRMREWLDRRRRPQQPPLA